jgi:hypothetical protein
MLFISHRGCLYGPDQSIENTQVAIDYAISIGLDVEIDVWYTNGCYFLGHDEPVVPVSVDYLKSIKGNAWVHCKNIPALYMLDGFNTFFHDTDDCVLTRNGMIWTYPGKDLTFKSIAVLPERCSPEYLNKVKNAYGVCTDYIFNYKNLLGSK